MFRNDYDTARNEQIMEGAERIARGLPIVLFIGDRRIDIDDVTKMGDEIHVSVAEPVYEHESRSEYVLVKKEDLAAMLQVNPEQYNPGDHECLLSDEERKDMAQSLRGAA